MFYVDILKRLKQRINDVRCEITDLWKLHHDNALSHSAFVLRDYLTRIGVATVATALQSRPGPTGLLSASDGKKKP